MKCNGDTNHMEIINKNIIKTSFFVLTLDVLAVFLIGRLSVALSPADYTVISGIIFLIIIAVLLFKNIKLLTYIFIIIFPFDNLSFFITISSSRYDWIRVTPRDIFMLFAAIILFFYMTTHKNFKNKIINEKFTFEYLHIILLGLISLGVFSMLWAPRITMSMNYIFRLLQNALMYFLVIHMIKTDEDVIRNIKMLIVSSVITAVGVLISTLPFGDISKEYTLSNWLVMQFIFDTYQIRASGFTTHKNAALLLSIGILFATGMLSQSKDNHQKLKLFLTIVFLTLVDFYTTARGPIISLLLTILFLIYALKDFKKLLIKNLSIFAVCFISIFCIFMVTHSYIIDFATGYLGKGFLQSEHAVTDRLSIWKKAIGAVMNSNAYLYGIGAGVGADYVKPEPHVHDILLSIFVDFGIIGLIPVLIIIFVSVRRVCAVLSQIQEGFPKAMLLSASGCIITLGMTTLIDHDYSLDVLWYIASIGVVVYRYAVSSSVHHKVKFITYPSHNIKSEIMTLCP